VEKDITRRFTANRPKIATRIDLAKQQIGLNDLVHGYKKYFDERIGAHCSVGVLHTALKRPKTLSGLDA